MRFCKVVIEPCVYFFWALLLLVLPLPWFGAFFLGALFHESLHILSLLLARKMPEQIRIGLHGIQLDVQDLTHCQELLCALAGPCAGFLLMGIRSWYPELSVVALAQSVYNLIPIYPLDGGRAIRCLFAMLQLPHADVLCQTIEFAAYAAILTACIVFKMTSIAVFIGCTLAGKFLCGKIPCKQVHIGLQ